MAVFVVLAISAITIGAYAISVNKDSSGNIVPNQLTGLWTPLINTPSGTTNIKTSHIPLKVPERYITTKTNMLNHIPELNIISAVEAQEIAKTYIEVSGATPGSPELVTQEGKKVYMSM